MSGLIRRIATALLRKDSAPVASMLALPAPASALMRRQEPSGLMHRPERKAPPLLHGTPVYPEPQHAMMQPPAPPPAGLAPRRRLKKKTVTVTETITYRRY